MERLRAAEDALTEAHGAALDRISLARSGADRADLAARRDALHRDMEAAAFDAVCKRLRGLVARRTAIDSEVLAWNERKGIEKLEHFAGSQFFALTMEEMQRLRIGWLGK